MKVIRLVLLLAVVLMGAVNAQAEKKGEKTITFNANLHCNSCKAKVEKNIPFEKGVKDLKVDMEKQTITVTFREDKNNVESLRKAIEKLGIQIKDEAAKPAAACQKGCCKGEKK